ncbi:MAG TPA: AAA family ATPase [Amycolatopsis sp.]|nr:AAA family ATPase [Amycolatopsis sp.]
MSAGHLIALIGAPGAGKTTLRTWWPAATVVSLDDNRRLLSPCGCSANQDETLCAAAVQLGFDIARPVLAAAGTVLWDATNAVAADRRALLVLAAETGATATAVVITTPVVEALARNATRDEHMCWCGYARRVPDAVVTQMCHDIEQAHPTLPREGWDAVLTTAGSAVSGQVRL